MQMNETTPLAMNAAIAECKGRGHAVDVGAHYGTVSALFVEAFQKVTAVEPCPRSFGRLTENAADWPNIELMNVAFGSACGRFQFNRRRNSKTSNSSIGAWIDQNVSGDTECTTVDECDFDSLDLLKIDCEGTDVFVLDGAIKTIQKYRPVVIFEDKPSVRTRIGVELDFDLIDHPAFVGYRPFHKFHIDQIMVPE